MKIIVQLDTSGIRWMKLNVHGDKVNVRHGCSIDDTDDGMIKSSLGMSTQNTSIDK